MTGTRYLTVQGLETRGPASAGLAPSESLGGSALRLLLAAGALPAMSGHRGLVETPLTSAFVFTTCPYCVHVCPQIDPFYKVANHTG